MMKSNVQVTLYFNTKQNERQNYNCSEGASNVGLETSKIVCLPAEAKEHLQSSDGGTRQERKRKTRSVRDIAALLLLEAGTKAI